MFQRALTIEEICNKLRPVYGEKIDKLYFRYTIAESKEEKEDIAHVLNALYQKNLNQLLDKGVLLEPPKKEVMNGTYPIGTISYAKKKLYPFMLREKDWPRHICITGMSGSGKTTLAFEIVKALTQNNKPYLIFDWKKSFRPLVKNDSSIQVFTIGEEKVSNLFKLNINVPPKGIGPKECINVLSDLLVECFSASFGVHKVVLETLDESFKEWGIYNGSENYPTWNHIKYRLEEKLEKIQGREAGWLESALRIATVLTFGDFGKIVNYKGKESISIEDLLNKRVIMELNSLGTIEKTFFCDFLLTYIYKLKKAKQNEANHGFDHAIIVDEAHNIFLKRPTNFASESVTDMIYREMREYGTSLVCLDQHISKISDTVKGNSACLIAFQQQLPADIEDICGLMQLQDKKHYFSQLPVGKAVVKLSERYTDPFLIEVNFDTVRNTSVSNDEVKGRMQTVQLEREVQEGEDKHFNQALVQKNPREKLSPIQAILAEFVQTQISRGIKKEDLQKILEESKTQGGYTSKDILLALSMQPKVPTEEIIEEEVSFKNSEIIDQTAKIEAENPLKVTDEDRVLQFLRDNPNHTLSATEMYKKLGLSARKGTLIKQKLEGEAKIRVIDQTYEKGWKKFIRLA